MATTDPRTTIKNTVDANLGVITNDAGGASTVLSIWEGGPETLKYLFTICHVLLTFGEPRSRAIRPIQDVPVHYLMRYPITVTTVNIPLTGVGLTHTAARMQYKVTYALRAAIPVTAQSVGVPAFTMRLVEDVASHKRIGGLDVWQATHYVEYETDYG
ncbi:unnamed protein product [marine sediment metagenome]|uniref:Uncharacterized protein n=1 Tax=marine sediment metagenome TaxID=412755 RepID=X0VJ68_9ZZZZ